MHATPLVKMANHIGQFFDAMPAREQALQELAEHLCKFWTPAMRHSLLTHWRAGAAPPLQPIVCEALQAHHHQLTPPAAAAHPESPLPS